MRKVWMTLKKGDLWVEKEKGGKVKWRKGWRKVLYVFGSARIGLKKFGEDLKVLNLKMNQKLNL